MIDPLVSLSFSLVSKKGIFALLLGSGVSRSASIPTGWEIVLDLICKIATLSGENCEDDPVAWYREHFRDEPKYSTLIDMVAKAPAERNQLLKSYFEPTVEDLEQGHKLPTKAHGAIASLVARGYIRVIITTNFDRLLEKALDSLGIVPVVISTPDSIEGALPLSHIDCTIIKVHGDYLDTRIKNTSEELQIYDERLTSLLDRIFDEYGLIVCGWSAEWDEALRACFERCKNHRFTTYWTTRKILENKAKQLAALRRAEIITIKDADDFFEKLQDKVIAIEEYNTSHPLTVKAAISTLKRYLPEEKYLIKLHDFIMEETNMVCKEITEDNFPVYSSDEEFPKRLKRYESVMETLIMLIIHGCYWGNTKSNLYWKKCLERVSNIPEHRGGAVIWLTLRRYPALLLTYAGGISAIASKNYECLKLLLMDSKVSNIYEENSLVMKVNIRNVFQHGLGKDIPGFKDRITPVNDYLFTFFQSRFNDLLPNDISYQRCFDSFEYLASLIYVDILEKQQGDIGGPYGSFIWREMDDRYSVTIAIMTDLQEMKENWPPLKVGLFDGSYERANYIITGYNELLKGYRLRNLT